MGEKHDQTWHPLVCHCLDVAACADEVLQREPERSRLLLAEALGLNWEQARPWVLLLVACHDLGKASPGFQHKWAEWDKSLREKTGLVLPKLPDTQSRHEFLTTMHLPPLLMAQGWPQKLAELAADACGSHHGTRLPLGDDRDTYESVRLTGNAAWGQARGQIFKALLGVLQPQVPPSTSHLSATGFMLLAGLTSFADWLGSDTAFFPYSAPEVCQDLAAWYPERQSFAKKALDGIGWQPRLAVCVQQKSFAELLGYAPRPLQQATEQAVACLEQPAVLLIEAPMGEGKTEAAWFAHVELQRRFGHRGLYVALPTQATGNAMFERVLRLLEQHSNRPLDLQLVHGAARLNPGFEQLKLASISDGEKDEKSDERGHVRAGEWFGYKKRALLSEYGVGTVDQALLSILPVKHHFVRMWGLANRVVVLDEVHAYDTYTATLLENLVRWLVVLGSSVVLLSATLPPDTRRRLAKACGATLPEATPSYPRLSVFQPQRVSQITFQADPSRRRCLQLQGIGTGIDDLQRALDQRWADRASALALVNTVGRAQQLYDALGSGQLLRDDKGHVVGKRLDDGSEVLLFHARFTAESRLQREQAVLERFGPQAPSASIRRLLIATQVAEQSLDVDFDLVITDLAPIDLVLQRAGRLWRHSASTRVVAEPWLLVAGLGSEDLPDMGKPLWWKDLYREDVLIRTFCALKQKTTVVLPDEIDALVSGVYECSEPIAAQMEQRHERALMEAEGQERADRYVAWRRTFLPHDGSWDNPNLYQPNEEETLTRLSEDSVQVVVLPATGFDLAHPPKPQAELLRHSLNLSRQWLVKKLRAQPVPWPDSALLRQHRVLLLDEHGCWQEDKTVCLDEQLGLVYDASEKR